MDTFYVRLDASVLTKISNRLTRSSKYKESESDKKQT